MYHHHSDITPDQAKALAHTAKAWPFAEARTLADRLEKMGDDDTRPVLFETGYGPSGLPHIGTFAEVVRTSMVRYAFEHLTGRTTRLICFSDDMDGLRKIPDNIPQAELISPYLDRPLTDVPDPFGTHSSFGAHNNARLQSFLDGFGFEYEFISATDMYKSGQFDDALRHMLVNHDAIRDVILPTLGEDRKKTYSPFLPICPDTGKVLQAKVVSTDPDAGMLSYEDPDTGDVKEVSVTSGGCKMQWKADWAMRWYALGVDYEMSGKDLIDSVTLSSQIVRLLGGVAPAGFSYELFLDQDGKKISKSKGNGLSVEEWLRYGSPESLAMFMFGQPKRAKRLYFDSIPKAVDEYASFYHKLAEQDAEEVVENPAFHIRLNDSKPPQDSAVSFNLLLNLAAVCAASTTDEIWGYLSSYVPNSSKQSHPELDRLAEYALRYYQDRVAPFKTYRAATEPEKQLITELRDRLAGLSESASAQDIQAEVFATGKPHYEQLREWFSCLYQTMLGQDQGPRMGSFFKLYGLASSVALCEDVLNDRLSAPHQGS